MPRLGRAVAPGYPHHVIQRGNNRENVFFEKEDRTKYLSLLNKYAFKWNAPIMAYCLMSNHIHLLTKPLSEESLFKMMQGLTLCYTQYKTECTGGQADCGKVAIIHALWIMINTCGQLPDT
jgi:putative transposase